MAALLRAQDELFPQTPDLYAPKTEALNEIVKMQTANVQVVAGDPLNSVRIAWQDSSAIQAVDCAPNCNLDGPQTGTDQKLFSLNGCTQVTFKKEVVVGNDPYSAYSNGIIGYAKSLAIDMMQGKRVIQERIAPQMLVKLATFAGVNADATGQYGAVVGTGAAATNTTIPAANWNENLFTYLQMEAQINRMVRPYVLDGVQNGLYLRHLNAVPNALNDNQRDQQAKFNLIETCFDYFTFAAAGLTNVDYVVDGTAVAFAARNLYNFSGIEHPEANTSIFSVPGPISQGIDQTAVSGGSLFDIDVTVQRVCQVVNMPTANGTKAVKKWFDVYEMKVPFYDLIADPYRLGGGTNTGVLKFTKGS